MVKQLTTRAYLSNISKYSDDTLYVLITILLNAAIKHGYLPSMLMESIITPIVKDKNGNITDTSNHRPITIASTISKVLENIILDTISKHIKTTCNQFGFKKVIARTFVILF